MNRHTYQGIFRYIWRHMVRAMTKSTLAILVIFTILITLGWLQETINRTEIAINHLFETTYVFGQIVPKDRSIVAQYRDGGDVITRQTLDEIITSGLVNDVYFDIRTPWALITRPNVDGTFPWEILDEIAGYGNVFDAWEHRAFLNELIATADIDRFISRHILDEQILDITFAPEFDRASFVYTDESLEEAIPVILSEQIMMMNGFEHGDIVSIGHRLNREQALWEELTAVIIGMHHLVQKPNTILIPLAAWESAPGDIIGFTTLQFVIDPTLNRELSVVRERIEEIITQSGAGFTPLMLDLRDEELRFVVQPMKENASLLWLLYPVVVIVSMLIIMGLAFYLTLQNEKNVAVMYVLGETRKRACIVLWIEQIVLCLSGLILGLGLLVILNWGFGVLELFVIAGLCLFSVMTGSAVSLFVITRYSPIELLQVKE